MIRYVHGLLSLSLMCLGLGIGLMAVLKVSVLLGIVYGAIIGIAMTLVLYAYCTKCSCRHQACGHVIPGLLVKILPERGQGPYQSLDYAILGISALVMILFPQFWLWPHKILFGIFWASWILGIGDILFYVCPSCQNEYCPICHKTKLNDGQTLKS